jgi:hypothetical protein
VTETVYPPPYSCSRRETWSGCHCESAVLNHFAIKAFCTLRNNNWIVCLKGTMTIGRFNLIPRPGLEPTVRIDICESAVLNHFTIKAFCTLRNNNWIQLLFRKVPNDPGLGCATSARLPNMRTVVGNPVSNSPCASRELCQSGGLTSYPGQDSNPRSELTFVRVIVPESAK